VAHQDHVIEEALSRLHAVPWPFHAVAVHEAPTESPLWRAIKAGAAGQYQTLPGKTGVHHLLELPGTFAEYEARFSSKTRGTWKRKARKLEAEAGPLSLEVFTESTSVERLLTLVGPVSRLTYHYHLMGRDLSPSNGRIARNLMAWARRSWLRAYVLLAGERPIAYVIGSLVRRRYSYDLPGYDPAFQASSPGFQLLLRMIEDLIASGQADVLDFGSGHADYKEQLATRSFPEVSALLVRRTPYAQGVAHLHRGVLAGARGMTRVLERWQVKGHVKNWLRRRHLRGGVK
jgi:CelD/BcsL family acetyltransferase involved in cellulose biosynthesis